MFLGTHTPKLDDKGRFFLPAKFREELNGGLVITRQPDRCLAIFTPAAYQAAADRMIAGSSSIAKVRSVQRMFASGADSSTPDSQGRITVPEHLRNYAGLQREIVVIGALDHIEVWDTEAWTSYATAQEEAFAQMDEEVFGAG
jgi:MraZ protein